MNANKVKNLIKKLKPASVKLKKNIFNLQTNEDKAILLYTIFGTIKENLFQKLKRHDQKDS